MPLWHTFPYSDASRIPSHFYRASKDLLPQVASLDLQHLSVRGVVIGKIDGITSNISLSDYHVETTRGIHSSTQQQKLCDIVRLILRDIWDPKANRFEDDAYRMADCNLTHFEDFCAFVLENTQKQPDPLFIPLDDIHCDVCLEKQRAMSITSVDDVVHVMHCDICLYGEFDMCTSCYRNGKTCHGNDEHQLLRHRWLDYHATSTSRLILC